MRRWLLLSAVLVASSAGAQAPAANLWTDLAAKREALPSLHQEFKVLQTMKLASTTESQQYKIVLDMAQNKWRERTIRGSDDRVRIFDGQDLFWMDAGGDEYVHNKRKPKDPDPVTRIYPANLELSKATVGEQSPCGLPGKDHTCVLIQSPLKAWARPESDGQITRLSGGVARMLVDTETGMLVQSYMQEAVDDGQGGYTLEMQIALVRVGYGAAPDPALFTLPDGNLHEVKELTQWNVSRIKKELVGKPAPDLSVTDISGNPISLSALKGKTVLLDFWTTWCPPCRADAPELDKLYKKYGGKDLMIVGFSVNEDRGVVEKFLKDHPHEFPVVLTSENDMPHPYQINAFPTYIVIAPDGTVASAADGDQGFGELRKFLEKAGMQAD